MVVKRRSIFMIIILSFITCGVYLVYWFMAISSEIYASLNKEDISYNTGILDLLLTIITCGIFLLFWFYKQGQQVTKLGKRYNVSIENKSILYLILCFLFIGFFINPLIIQYDLNKIVAFGDESPNLYLNLLPEVKPNSSLQNIPRPIEFFHKQISNAKIFVFYQFPFIVQHFFGWDKNRKL